MNGNSEVSAPTTARTRTAGRKVAPLDELLYQDGDLSKVPVVPHDLGMTRLQHADSSLLLERVPGNVTEKDFIRRGQSLRPLSIIEKAQRVRNPAKRESKLRRNRFNYHTYNASLALDQEIERLKMEEARQREWERELSEAEARRERQHAHRELDDDGIKEADRGAGTRSGGAQGKHHHHLPSQHHQHHQHHHHKAEIPRHPETVPESEAVRGSAAATTSVIVRRLADRAGAPLINGPEPAHHFYAGGSSSQLRKERRREIEKQRLQEANLELRKQKLVDRNLEVLADIGQQEAVNRQLAQQFQTAVDRAMPPSVPMPVALLAASSVEQAAPMAGGLSTAQAGAQSEADEEATSRTTKAVAILGAAVAVSALVYLAGVVVASRANGKAGGRK